MIDAIIAMILTWLIPAIGAAVFFYCWEPRKMALVRKRTSDYADKDPHIEPGITYMHILDENGVQIMDVCYMKVRDNDRFIFQSLIDGCRLSLNGEEVEKYKFLTYPNPIDRDKLLLVDMDGNFMGDVLMEKEFRKSIAKTHGCGTIYGPKYNYTDNRKK